MPHLERHNQPLYKELVLGGLKDALISVKDNALKGFNVFISVNIGACVLKDVKLMGQIVALLEKSECFLSLIKFEITEHEVLSQTMLSSINTLKSLGVKVSLDDYGTGHASLSKIKELPFDEVKIDKSLLKGIDKEGKDLEFYEGVVSLCSIVGVDTVAEGIESKKELLAIRDIGCNYVQGFYFGEPIPFKQAQMVLFQVV